MGSIVGSISFMGLQIRVDSFGGGGAVETSPILLFPQTAEDGDQTHSDAAWQSAMHLYSTACSSREAPLPRGSPSLSPTLGVHHRDSEVP